MIAATSINILLDDHYTLTVECSEDGTKKATVNTDGQLHERTFHYCATWSSSLARWALLTYKKETSMKDLRELGELLTNVWG